MTIHYAALTRKGAKRAENQDRVVVAGTVLEDGTAEGVVEDSILAVVCDGVGGELAGARAAALASESFTGLVDASNPPLSIFRQIDCVDEAIRSESKGRAHGDVMASTIAGVYLDERERIVFNAGDTRVYEFANGRLQLLSDDHTRAQAMVDALFARTAEELPAKTQRTITRCLGGSGSCRPAFQMSPAVSGGSRTLVCSDGAYRALGEDGLKDLLSKEMDLSACCESVYGKALAAGSDDDISIIMLEEAS